MSTPIIYTVSRPLNIHDESANDVINLYNNYDGTFRNAGIAIYDAISNSVFSDEYEGTISYREIPLGNALIANDPAFIEVISNYDKRDYSKSVKVVDIDLRAHTVNGVDLIEFVGYHTSKQVYFHKDLGFVNAESAVKLLNVIERQTASLLIASDKTNPNYKHYLDRIEFLKNVLGGSGIDKVY